ncbi:MAG TPA: hypothetical protein VGJ26_17815 [Pirellulales bacterium]|jgi:hypothetical protein
MEKPPRRRWFRYSLRTMFVVVTVVACCLGYQLNWISGRHSLIAASQKTGVEAEYEAVSQPMSLRAPLKVETKDAPWPLRWFGERGVYTLYIRDDMPESEVARIRALFPEAEIERVYKDYFDVDEPE